MECIVEFEYEAQEDDELTLNKGDIISNVSMYEDGWMKGVLRGKEGVFPDNFVKIIKSERKLPESKNDNFRKSQEDLVAHTTKPQNTETLTPGQKARVVHKYAPRQKDELALELGSIVDIIEMQAGEEDDGWLRGSFNGKVGVFPANFVVPLSPGSSRRLQGGTQESGDNSQTSGPRKIVGVDLRNIFAGERIPLRPTSVKDPKREVDDSVQAPKLVPRPNNRGQPSSNVERVIVKFPYKGENADELTIEKGNIITIIEKNLEDDGWWKGELNGKVGVFPDNFVEPFPIGSSHKDGKSKAPLRPAPPLPPSTDKPTINSDKPGGKKGPAISKKPQPKVSANGRDKGDGLGAFDSVPGHEHLQPLTSDRPRVANQRPPTNLRRPSVGKDGVSKGPTPRQTVAVQENVSVEKEEEIPFINRDPPAPPRPSPKPTLNSIAQQEPLPQTINSSNSILNKTVSVPLSTSKQPAVPPPVPAPSTEPGVTAADLTELRRVFDNRLSQEISELRAEMERMRSALTGRIHSLTAEIDEEKRMRHSAQVELERVRRLLQERELTPVAVGGDALPHQTHSTA